MRETDKRERDGNHSWTPGQAIHINWDASNMKSMVG
jgi:hypothetical protein